MEKNRRKMSELQAGIILKLNSIEKIKKNAYTLVVSFDRDYKYICENLRTLLIKGYIYEASKIGHKKFYEPTKKGLLLALQTLGVEDEPIKNESKEGMEESLQPIKPCKDAKTNI